MDAARRLLATLLAVAAAGAAGPPVLAQQPEVRAVLFYSPTCPHCHTVMEQHLPPLMERFGEQLQLVTINAATPDGGRLYQDVVSAYGVPRSRLGVPALVVGGRLLVGADEIPQQLPGIITAGLERGGIDWPDVASIRNALSRAGLLQTRPAEQNDEPQAEPAPTMTPAPSVQPDRTQRDDAVDSLPAPPDGAAPTVEPDTALEPVAGAGAGERADTAGALAGQRSLRDVTASAPPETALGRFMRDPVANGVAVAVLAGLFLVLAWSVVSVSRGVRMHGTVPGWLIPALVLCGMAVAGYLSYIEVTGTQAVCGPVGDCNTVQQSPYATLFGVLPVGVLGLIGYAGMGVVWLFGRSGPARRRHMAALLLWAAALAGTTFSAYLTFLEPFVIGASCAWCLTSAAVTAVLLMAATVGLGASRGATAQPG